MGWLLITLGAILIALGGILGTYGWQRKSQDDQKTNLIRSVAAEMLLNMNILDDVAYTETNTTKLSKFVVFPRLKTTALEGAISSGLFLQRKRQALFYSSHESY